jgi:hypothetical protein
MVNVFTGCSSRTKALQRRLAGGNVHSGEAEESIDSSSAKARTETWLVTALSIAATARLQELNLGGWTQHKEKQHQQQPAIAAKNFSGPFVLLAVLTVVILQMTRSRGIPRGAV